MDLEATIVERLQKLRQWQLEQQERLLKEQQMQREILTQKQDCMYKALELSLQELDISENVLDVNDLNKIKGNPETDNQDLEDHNELQNIDSSIEMISQNVNKFNNLILQQTPLKDLGKEAVILENHVKQQLKEKNDTSLTLLSPRQEKEVEKFIIDGVAPLSSNKALINRMCIDDVPIPSPKKDFHTLLEERLKDSDNISTEKSNGNSTAKVIKKPFLKKGEGLSRFKLNKELPTSTIKRRSRSVSFSTCTQSDSKQSKNVSKSTNSNKSTKNAQQTNSLNRTNASQKQLCLKNVPLPKKKVRSKSESSTLVTKLEDYVNNIKNTAELNTSDFHSGTQKEMEEVRIFELLEEKAENSSFCSTSSTVLAFLQQSTPFKVKKHQSPIIKNSKSQSVLKSNQAYMCTTPTKNNESFRNYSLIVNKKDLPSMKDKNPYSAKAFEDFKENTKIDASIKKYATFRNQVQSMHNEDISYDGSNVEKANDVSLHVRFSEYNEYKTIGSSDTSCISIESLAIKDSCDKQVWDDSVTTEVSDTEMLPQSSTAQGNIQNSNYKFTFEHCNAQGKLNYEAQTHKTMEQNNSFDPNENIHQQVYYNDDSEFSDTTVQTLDNEQDILEEYKKNLIVQNVNNFQNTGNSRKCMEPCNTGESKELLDINNDSTMIEDQRSEENLQETDEIVFKSELLKNRLLELEQEISIFRKENAALSAQRKKLLEDHRNLRKEYAEKEKNLEESRKQMEDRLQEEKKKLIREKSALENRMRDSQEKAQQSKLERQEIQNLKQEFETLKEEFQLKESRWYAAQSRHKCQMRILKMENSKLKQEIERLQNLRKSNARSKGKPGIFSNTKAIHQINKQIDMQNKESKRTNDNSSSDEKDQKLPEPVTKIIDTNETENIEDEEYNCKNNNSSSNKKLQRGQINAINVVKKRNLYENLIKEATSDLLDVHEQLHIGGNLSEPKSDLDNESRKLNKSEDAVKNNSEELIKESDIARFNDTNSNSNLQFHVQHECEQLISPPRISHKHHNQNPILISSDESSSNACVKRSPSHQSSSDVNKQGIRQIQHPDGRIEYWYPNGNVKKVFPDQGLTKLIYYNGDVRETSKEGKVKYFYASTRTWHTTMPDGSEILEFTDGQIERRLHDGAVEVSFPDGSIRVLGPDGTEKWTLPDGTLIQTFANGEKVFTLPNGQQEIHTKTHKRREYPDGTVKLIYPDGTQETRYSNGRIRLKDKDGNLLMDSYQ
ncbi:spindle assembly abnormal 4 isoform X1 [Nomia melanderi]|uniref:spindle assembly abnormal 4 isoform X1 n=2 Tax=Nomia melanderi TaxID=2448451 RepID=UPI003FCC6258